MRALRLVEYNKPYQLRDDVPVPTPGPGELLIRIAASAFCHTDYLVYRGLTGIHLPATGSHEPAGTVVSLGPDVPDAWHLGDRVGITNFMKPCDACNGCRWSTQTSGSLDPRFCANKAMCGIIKADGGFAEYMKAWHGAVVHLPDSLSFEQAAPLMCAGATVWNGIKQAGLKTGQSIAIVGIGGLGVLGVQFAKALGYRVVAVDRRDVGLKLASEVPAHLRPDLVVGVDDSEAGQKISDFTDGIGLNAAVVCTGDESASDWAAEQLQPRGVIVAAGIPEQGFRLDPLKLVLREIVVKGVLHCSMDETRKMMDVVVEHGVVSHLTMLPLEKGEDIPEKAAAYAFEGRLVLTIGKSG
ncbi:hypothetical protein ACJ41O_013506 [Fusarium nematophilum]